VLSSTIQSMEVQRASIATFKSFMAAGANAAQAQPGTSPLEEVLGLRPAAASAAPQSGSSDKAQENAPSVDAAGATQAWWGLLQEQFNTIAAATAATMQEAAASAGAPDDTSRKPASPKKSSTRAKSSAAKTAGSPRAAAGKPAA